VSDSWAGFTAQVQTQANAGFRLASFTTIQNFNRTFYYGACQKGTGDWQLTEFSDENSFYTAFQNNQNGFYLADFNVSFQGGRLYYYGYWLSGAKRQTLLRGLVYEDLRTQWAALSTAAQSPMQMTRVQAYPLNDSAAYHALFESEAGSFPFHRWPVYQNVAANVSGSESFATQVASITTNTLTGLCYDPVFGAIAGCWGNLAAGAMYFQDLSWDGLNTMAQTSASGLVLAALTVYPDAPDWDDYFEANLAPYVMGYAWAVAKNGQPVAAGGGGFARGPNETQNPNKPFTADTRIVLASVSKVITGVALEVLAAQNPEQPLNSLFLPVVMPRLTKAPTPAAASVTLANLAAMESGLFQYPKDSSGSTEGPADITDSVGGFGPYASTWADISDYLSQTPQNPVPPGTTYDYNNTNYAILQAFIELAANPSASDPGDYVNWVTQNLLTPVGMDASIVNPVPDQPAVAALAYTGPNDSGSGYYRQQITLVGASGWISSARELLKLMTALRGAALLPQATVASMFSGAIGAWVSSPNGTFGTPWYKEGTLTKVDDEGNSRSVSTGVAMLPEGYDVVVVANTLPPIPVFQVAINAFEARGLSTANLPAGPSLMAAANAASYLPNIAPGGFVSVFGSGLIETPATDWTQAITKDLLPAELGGVSVRIGGQWASIAYVSPTQVNFILPGSTSPGMTDLELGTPLGGVTLPVTIEALAPALFTYQLNSVTYAAAVIANQHGVVYVAVANALSGEMSRPAVAGDSIEMYGTGMGPTTPVAPGGVVLTETYPANLANFSVTIGGVAATVSFAGLVAAGVFQINIAIPANVAGGNQPIVVTVNGAASQANVMISIQT
jgi:uncharacterized protein (TIGR03437 family)